MPAPSRPHTWFSSKRAPSAPSAQPSKRLRESAGAEQPRPGTTRPRAGPAAHPTSIDERCELPRANPMTGSIMTSTCRRSPAPSRRERSRPSARTASARAAQTKRHRPAASGAGSGGDADGGLLDDEDFLEGGEVDLGHQPDRLARADRLADLDDASDTESAREHPVEPGRDDPIPDRDVGVLRHVGHLERGVALADHDPLHARSAGPAPATPAPGIRDAAAPWRMRDPPSRPARRHPPRPRPAGRRAPRRPSRPR